MRVLQFSAMTVFLCLATGAAAQEGENETSIEKAPVGVAHEIVPAKPWATIAVAPSIWYSFIERSGPVFRNGIPQSIGTQSSNMSGAFSGITVAISPKTAWFSDNGWLAKTSFSFSAYGAHTTGNYSTAYYKNSTNTEDDNWWGNAKEGRQDYEILAERRIDNVFGPLGQLKFVYGLRYLKADTSAVGIDIFNQQLTYTRSNKYVLGEAGLRLQAPLVARLG